MTSDPALMTASQMLSLFREGSLSPVEATRAALERIAGLNETLNAFNLVDEENALASARESEERWRLKVPRGRVDGVPTSIKDLMPVQGWPSRRGSLTSSQAADEEDAPCVARLKEHGAVLLGKTTTPEFGWKGVTDSPLTGVTRNPWNTELTPGGSSGGAAVAVATGMGALATGTDGGGSIRIPAAFTGIVGHKPSYGRVPAYPLSPFALVSHVGPMTRSVVDAALMLTVIAEPDCRDPFALPYDATDYSKGLEDGIEGLTIAYSARLGDRRVEAEIENLVAQAARQFVDLGAKVVPVDPDLPEHDEAFRTIWYTAATQLLQSFTDEQKNQLDPGLIEIAEAGSRCSLSDFYAAMKVREALRTAMNLFHQTYDLLITPSLPLEAFGANQEVPRDGNQQRWVNWTPFTYPFNVTGQPAISIPCGLTSAGLPAGLQIVGPAYADALVLKAARAFEAVNPVTLPNAYP